MTLNKARELLRGLGIEFEESNDDYDQTVLVIAEEPIKVDIDPLTQMCDYVKGDAPQAEVAFLFDRHGKLERISTFEPATRCGYAPAEGAAGCPEVLVGGVCPVHPNLTRGPSERA